MDKKYTERKADSLSIKEQPPITEAGPVLRFASPEVVREAVSQVMKLHGAALEKLSK